MNAPFQVNSFTAEKSMQHQKSRMDHETVC